MTISVVQLGQVDYAAGLRIQQRLVDLRKSGHIGDVLLLLVHTPVITLGRNAKANNVLASPEHLSRRGVEVFECDRGGDVTFHGPGQLVGYPIFDLRGFRRQPSAVSHQESSSQEEQTDSTPDSWLTRRGTLGAVDYVRRLEEVLIRTCAEFEILTERVPGLTGVWTKSIHDVEGGECPAGSRGPSTPRHDSQSESARSAQDDRRGDGKIAAIGVHISRGVTSHGFALNVNTDLTYFDLIVPCGIQARPVTSMQKELGREIQLGRVAESVARMFGNVFGRNIVWVETIDALLGNAVGIPMRPPSELRALHGENDSFLA
jgi:lipoyl(octanoyl) transferase